MGWILKVVYSFSQKFLTLKLLVLVDRDALLLRPMEEREGEDGDGGDGWRNTSMFVMIFQFSRQDPAARKDREASCFDLICLSYIRSGQISFLTWGL